MSGRDRLVLTGLVTIAVLVGAWMLLVSPEREKAATLQTQVTAASAQLAAAESQVANARAAEASYAAAYATIVKLGKAVPASQEVPSLIYELAQATHEKNVDFTSIVSGASGSAATPAAASPVAAAGLTSMPFTFVFNGSYLNLYHFFQQLNLFAKRTASGGLQVNGRLLTIQSVKLNPVAASASQPGTSATAPQLTGTITATAYVLPASQSLTAGATAASPASLTGGPSTSPVSATAATPSSPSAPAVVGVTR
jgi:Tfp pilus assembly protein PilO